jgi:hypothetical protein
MQSPSGRKRSLFGSTTPNIPKTDDQTSSNAKESDGQAPVGPRSPRKQKLFIKGRAHRSQVCVFDFDQLASAHCV